MFHQNPMGLCWPFPASVSIVSAAVTSDQCVCVCRSPQRCTCSATPRARGTSRPCETVAASKDGSSLTRKWCVSPTPCREQTSTHPVEDYRCMRHVKKTKRHRGCLLWRGLYYCLCIPLYTAAAPFLALCAYKWALKCTQLGFSASVEGWHHTLVSRLFFFFSPWSASSWEGSSLMQGNLSGCNMRLAFQRCSLWGWQLLVLYAAPLAPAAPSFKAFFFSARNNW